MVDFNKLNGSIPKKKKKEIIDNKPSFEDLKFYISHRCSKVDRESTINKFKIRFNEKYSALEIGICITFMKEHEYHIDSIDWYKPKSQLIMIFSKSKKELK